jgi:tRNA A-37 threonylcarbamoyl transferase component Bud32/tetratricopeptide (TPR) repeat protein
VADVSRPDRRATEQTLSLNPTSSPSEPTGLLDPLGLLQGALAGRYTIERLLGRGGMATVYLARDLKHQRPVAIKVLRPELSDLLWRERFQREIEIAASLQHPHILPLHEFGTADRLLFYVMPYVEGESLRDRLDREKQLPLDEALQIAREIADALSYAHGHGVVHRDIKPENILLSGGHALVADFGIARAITAAGGEELTQSGIAVGTPAYMSPEQASGRDRIDGRSDLYALGCVVYEMLAGEPPFTGSTAQAIIARHMQERPPSLRVVRPTVSLAVQRVIERALAKVPADRYPTASQFVAALDAARSGRVERRRRVLQTVSAVAVVVAASALWRALIGPPPPLDTNKVVVFPLPEAPVESGLEGTGLAVAYVIESALEHTEPLRWIDGWSHLDPMQRSNPALLTAPAARRITRGRGARWYIAGAVVGRGDSATVMLRISDAIGDSVVGQVSATRPTPHVAQAGLDAVNKLLPYLLAPGRPIDLTALTERRPAAVTSWLQGESEYRNGNFDTALQFLRRAVREDSALAVAALRGAQAASWKSLLPEAERFADLALAHVNLLPARQGHFARGLAAYLKGQADSAVLWLTRALSTTADWTEAHMALGEVYHHLVPRAVGPLDSLAETAFRAAAADTGFAPPLFHLAEIAMRRRDFRSAERAVREFERFGSDSEERRQLALMLTCARDGREHVDWRSPASESPPAVLSAAKILSIAGAFPECAEDALRTLLATPTASAVHFGAFRALHGLLAAQGKSAAIVSLVDSLKAAGLWWATTVYLIDALAGTPGLDSKVDETLASLRGTFGRLYEDSLDGSRLLLLGAWYVRTRRLADAGRLYERLTRRAAKTSDPEVRLYADALAAHLVLAQGDSDAALAAFETLTPVAQRDLLVWGYAASLPLERLTRAALLLSRGRHQEGLDVASVFDHPTPIVYLPFLPASLALRYNASHALGRPDKGELYRDRLVALGRGDVLGPRN